MASNIYLINNRYTVKVSVNGKPKHIGVFYTEDDAIKARDKFMRSVGRAPRREHERLEDIYAYSPCGDLLHIGTDISASCNRSRGYKWVRFKKRQILLHRAIYTMHFGEIPPSHMIDHINGDPSDNRIENLRLADPSQNARNCRVAKNNKLGVKGVCFCKHKNKYRATIRHSGKNHHLGYFTSAQEAVAAHTKASMEFHGEFGRSHSEESSC